MLSLALLAASLVHSAPDTVLVFDSAGIRRPELRLASLAPDWKPALLANAEPVWTQRFPRQRLATIAGPFTGNWAADFPQFKHLWPAAVKDGSWELLVAAFWRRIQGLDSDYGDGPSPAQWPVILGQWADWIETADIRLRPALGEATGRELCRAPEMLMGPVVAPGGSLLLDMTRPAVQGPVTIQIQRWQRKGIELVDLVAMPSPKPWEQAKGERGMLSIRLPEPGLYRVVLRAPGWYNQVLAQAALVPTMTAATDSGALVWAPGGGKVRKQLIWKTREGKVDSVRLGDQPVHVGLSSLSDSGLVAVACGQELSPLRLRRARPDQADAAFGSTERDWYGRPVAKRASRRSQDFAWHSSLVATPDAVDEGDWLRFSGVVRHLDAYGRPDSLRADSLVVAIDQDSVGTVHRTLRPDAMGVWADSVRVSRNARVMIQEIGADGRIVNRFYGATAQVRVRRVVSACLQAQDSSHRVSSPAEPELLPFFEDVPSGSLALLSSGRLLDWRPVGSPAVKTARIPPQPLAAGGGVVELLQGDSGSWASNRTHLRQEQQVGEGWMGLTIAGIGDTVQAGSKLALRIVPRNGGTAASRIQLALVPDSLAGSLRSQNVFQGRAWASQEISMPDQNVNRGGMNNGPSVWEEFDQGREPARLGRLGLLADPGLCIRCRPWTGSYSSGGGDPYEGNNGASFSLRNGPCLPVSKVGAPAVWTGPVNVAAGGEFPQALHWPATAGIWRLQAWGVDEKGRMLGWEKAVVVR